jgi:hypothetical protein
VPELQEDYGGDRGLEAERCSPSATDGSPGDRFCDLPDLCAQRQALLLSDLPSPPFRLDSKTKVYSADLFLRSLKWEAQLGADAPRARRGKLQQEIAALLRIVRKRKRENGSRQPISS